MHQFDKLDKFLKTYKLLKLTEEEKENLNRPITNKETESVIRIGKKMLGPDVITDEF